VVGSISCAVGCAALLDIPEDPRVGVEPDGMSPALGSPMETVPSDVGANLTDARTAEPSPQAIGLDAPDASNGGGGRVLDADRFDAGGRPSAEAVAPGEPDPTALACASTETLGPSGRCYLAISTAVPWLQAQEQCQAHGVGWDLATILNDATNQFISTLGIDEGWIGASDVQLEGDWVWVGEGTAFWRGPGSTGAALDGAYESWLGDEPNGELDSACARFVTVALGARLAAPAWADLECEKSLGFVCEGPAR
jgi:Lectin C-type domain